MIEETQKNVDQMKNKMFQAAPTASYHSNTDLASAAIGAS